MDMSTIFTIFAITYIVSFGLIIFGLVYDHLFAKYPNYFIYIQVIGLGLIPLLNTYIVLEYLYYGLKTFIMWLISLVHTKDNKLTDNNDTHYTDYDSASMYPTDIK